MSITLGNLLRRLESAAHDDEPLAYFMPRTDGPCRFGDYHVLHGLVLERLGWKGRVRVCSPDDTDYFAGLPASFSALAMTGLASIDVLEAALLYVRPIERRPGAAQEVYDRFEAQLLTRLEAAGGAIRSATSALLQVGGGKLFGCAAILREASAAFAAVMSDRTIPTVLLVGETYVRCNPAVNGFVVENLERRGLRVKMAPFTEWFEYLDWLEASDSASRSGRQLARWVKDRIQERTWALMARPLGWPRRSRIAETIDAGGSYLSDDLAGEAILSVGAPVHEWREGRIAGAVLAGPLECMPSKIAEAQLFHAAEEEGLPSLTLPLNGDPIDPELFDSFAFDVLGPMVTADPAPPPARPVLVSSPSPAPEP